jgi:hypothetical protein
MSTTTFVLSQVGQGPDGDDGQALLDAATEHLGGSARRTRSRGDVIWPVALVSGGWTGDTARDQRRLFAGDDGDALPTGEGQAVGDAGGPLAAGVDRGGDTGDVDAGPAQEHRQGARVVRISTQIRIEMHARARVAHGAGATASPAAIAASLRRSSQVTRVV